MAKDCQKSFSELWSFLPFLNDNLFLFSWTIVCHFKITSENTIDWSTCFVQIDDHFQGCSWMDIESCIHEFTILTYTDVQIWNRSSSSDIATVVDEFSGMDRRGEQLIMHMDDNFFWTPKSGSKPQDCVSWLSWMPDGLWKFSGLNTLLGEFWVGTLKTFFTLKNAILGTSPDSR